MVVGIAARVAPLDGVLTAAADTDPAAAEMVAGAKRGRMYGATEFVRHLASHGGLAANVTEQHAADLCWSLMDGHSYRLLVIERGWTAAEFAQWLSSSLAAALF